MTAKLIGGLEQINLKPMVSNILETNIDLKHSLIPGCMAIVWSPSYPATLLNVALQSHPPLTKLLNRHNVSFIKPVKSPHQDNSEMLQHHHHPVKKELSELNLLLLATDQLLP
jgi:hypothetical protein